MKTKDLILITSDAKLDDLTGPGRTLWISRLRAGLETARRFDLNPILVLGPHGDEVLMLGPNLENCDLAFDPNFKGDLFSSVQAGLHAASGAAFVWPLSRSNAPDSVWEHLDQTMWSLKPDQACDVLRPVSQNEEIPYPQLVTVRGAHKVRPLPASTSWTASHLIVLEVPVISAPTEMLADKVP